VLHEGLKHRQHLGTRRVNWIRLRMMEIRVSRVEEPTLTIANRDPAMSPGVPDEWDQEDLGQALIYKANGIEVVPAFTMRFVKSPMGLMRPLEGAVAALFECRQSLHGGFMLYPGNVNSCLRKITDTGRMIHIEMGEDDMTDVLALKSQCLDLRKRGLPEVELGMSEGLKGSGEPPRGQKVAQFRWWVFKLQSFPRPRGI
jgi:hypothetical protein